MRGRLFALVAIAVILMAGVGAVQSAYRSSVSESQPETTVTNETFTVSEGSVTTLSESNRDVVYNDTVTLRQNGTVFDQSGNYSWLEANGTIQVQAGSGLTDGASANITYGYHVPENEQRLTRDLALVPLEVLGGDIVFLVGLFVFMAAFVVLIKAGGM